MFLITFPFVSPGYSYFSANIRLAVDFEFRAYTFSSLAHDVQCQMMRCDSTRIETDTIVFDR